MMTPEQARKAERFAALTAVVHALTLAEQQQALAATVRAVPEMRLAVSVAEVLDYTEGCDYFAKTDAFLAQHEDLAAAGVGLRFALDALNLLARPLTAASVTRLLVKAGIMDDAGGYDPLGDIAVVLAHLHKTGVMGGGDAGVALDNLRSHLDMRAGETIEASLRALYGKDA
jgi:hypothetical protein